MGAKKLKPRNVQLKSTDEKGQKNLKVVNKTALPAFSLDNEPSSDVSDSEAKRRLLCYRKINDLYQDDQEGLYNHMQGILNITCSGVNAEAGSLWIFEEDKNLLTCRVAIGTTKLEGTSVTISKGIVGWVYEKKTSAIVYDTTADERFSDKADRQAGFASKSVIASPLVYKSECIGVIEVVNKKSAEGKFTDADRYFLDDLCTPAAMYIKTTRLLSHQQSLLGRMKTISELHESFSSTMDLNKLLQMVLAKAIGLLKAEVGSVWIIDESGEGVECQIAEGPTKDKVIGLKLKKGAGIVGWVVENGSPIIVEDCSKDPRFSQAVDKKINFVTRTMICVPLSVKGECIGSIQIINKRGSNSLFDQDDVDLSMMFASSSAMYIKNATLFAAEKKAKELSALIEISSEITSTLDLDAVLMSIVNLSSHVIPYDDSCISFEKRGGRGKFEIRAQSGVERIDPDDEKIKELEKLHNEMSQTEDYSIYISDPSAKYDDQKGAPAIITYMEKYDLKSFWGQTLHDDQGVVGVLSMESAATNLISAAKKELLPLLTGQSTVALRNAELYDTIPSGNLVKNLHSKVIDTFLNIHEVSKPKLFGWTFGIAALVWAMIALKIPYNINTNIEILPIVDTYYAQSAGKVQQIMVKEGQRVKKGDAIALLDTTDLILEQKQKLVQRQKVTSEMLKVRSEGKIADYKIKEKELLSLDLELELIDKKLIKHTLVSQNDGVIVSADLESLIGKPVNFGQEILRVADASQIFVQFQVPEEDIAHVKVAQEIKFKVYGHPTHSFGDQVTILSVSGEGTQISDADPTKYYLARARIDKTLGENNILRIGMSGRGKIFTPAQSLGYVVLGRLFKFLAMEVFF